MSHDPIERLLNSYMKLIGTQPDEDKAELSTIHNTARRAWLNQKEVKTMSESTDKTRNQAMSQVLELIREHKPDTLAFDYWKDGTIIVGFKKKDGTMMSGKIDPTN